MGGVIEALEERKAAVASDQSCIGTLVAGAVVRGQRQAAHVMAGAGETCGDDRGVEAA